ncbi:MAG TPA: Ig-like domain-containing protein, partial [Gemmatimonadales bacterium]|nr:Ig-like domain-containing protein [Gemmatimonadales bacterium]
MIITRLLALAAAASPLAAQTVTEVQVAPPSISIKAGEHYGLIATAYDRVGNVLPAARIQWVSNNTAVARVDGSGTVTGVGAGVAIVEARAGQKRGQAAVQVAAAAGPQPTNPTTTTAAGGGDPFAGQPPGAGMAAVLRIDPPSVYLLP